VIQSAAKTAAESVKPLIDLGVFQSSGPLFSLMPLLKELGLSIRWVIGAAALALIEILVNRKLEELGLKTDGSFKQRVKRLSAIAEQKGVKIPNLLAKPFYDARSKVIHRGVEPSETEIKIIIEYLQHLAGSLKKVR